MAVRHPLHVLRYGQQATQAETNSEGWGIEGGAEPEESTASLLIHERSEGVGSTVDCRSELSSGILLAIVQEARAGTRSLDDDRLRKMLC